MSSKLPDLCYRRIVARARLIVADGARRRAEELAERGSAPPGAVAAALQHALEAYASVTDVGVPTWSARAVARSGAVFRSVAALAGRRGDRTAALRFSKRANAAYALCLELANKSRLADEALVCVEGLQAGDQRRWALPERWPRPSVAPPEPRRAPLARDPVSPAPPLSALP